MVTNTDVPLIVVKLLICIIGIAGNVLVLFVILVLREYKKSITHWYMLQLAIADSLFLLMIPFQVAENINKEWTFSVGMCKVKETIIFLNYYSSILFLIIMSIDRYIAVCHSFSDLLQKLRTKRAAYITIGVAWSISALLCIPIMIYSNKIGNDPHCICTYNFPKATKSHEEMCRESYNATEFEWCMEQPSSPQELCTTGYMYSGDGTAYSGDTYSFDNFTEGSMTPTDLPQYSLVMGTSSDDFFMHGCSYHYEGSGWFALVIFNFVIMFVIPFIIMAVCYTLIALRLAKTRVHSESNTRDMRTTELTTETTRTKYKKKRSKSSFDADRNRNRVTVVCFLLVTLFFVCWFPFHATHLAKLHGINGSEEFCRDISRVVVVFGFVNSALNPYLYNFIGTRFRKRLRSGAQNIQTKFKKGKCNASVHYQVKKRSEGSSSNTGTVMTKIVRGKSEVATTAELSSTSEGSGKQTERAQDRRILLDKTDAESQ